MEYAILVLAVLMMFVLLSMLGTLSMVNKNLESILDIERAKEKKMEIVSHVVSSYATGERRNVH